MVLNFDNPLIDFRNLRKNISALTFTMSYKMDSRKKIFRSVMDNVSEFSALYSRTPGFAMKKGFVPLTFTSNPS